MILIFKLKKKFFIKWEIPVENSIEKEKKKFLNISS